jgi:hypothetical protein
MLWTVVVREEFHHTLNASYVVDHVLGKGLKS